MSDFKLPEGFTFKVKVRPGFDKRHTDPSKNYGVGSVDLFFDLIGPKGATNFSCSTGIYPQSVYEFWRTLPELGSLHHRGAGRVGEPMGYSVNYHSPVPLHDFQKEEKPHDCDLLPGGKCYSDGSFLAGDDFLEALAVGGEPGVQEKLYGFYVDHFEEATNGQG